MENLKSQLQLLKDAQARTAPGWIWFFDEESGIVCAKKGKEIARVFTAHPDAADNSGYPTEACRNDALLMVQALNKLPNLIDALERVLGLAGELDEMASKRQQAALRARLAERYDLSEAHRQSVNRVRAIKEAFLQEIAAAFASSPEPASSISDYYQGNLNEQLLGPAPSGQEL